MLENDAILEICCGAHTNRSIPYFLFSDCFTHVNYDRDKIQIVVYTYIERAVSEGRNWKYVVVHTHML